MHGVAVYIELYINALAEFLSIVCRIKLATRGNQVGEWHSAPYEMGRGHGRPGSSQPTVRMVGTESSRKRHADQMRLGASNAKLNSTDLWRQSVELGGFLLVPSGIEEVQSRLRTQSLMLRSTE